MSRCPVRSALRTFHGADTALATQVIRQTHPITTTSNTNIVAKCMHSVNLIRIGVPCQLAREEPSPEGVLAHSGGRPPWRRVRSSTPALLWARSPQSFIDWESDRASDTIDKGC
jgi:hypothetical protein